MHLGNRPLSFKEDDLERSLNARSLGFTPSGALGLAVLVSIETYEIEINWVKELTADSMTEPRRQQETRRSTTPSRQHYKTWFVLVKP